jgi:hypothetical protein
VKSVCRASLANTNVHHGPCLSRHGTQSICSVFARHLRVVEAQLPARLQPAVELLDSCWDVLEVGHAVGAQDQVEAVFWERDGLCIREQKIHVGCTGLVRLGFRLRSLRPPSVGQMERSKRMKFVHQIQTKV